MSVKYKIKKNDSVVIIAGKDKGKTGNVLKVLHELGKVLVSGANIAIKAVKPSKIFPSGGMVKKELPIHISNVALLDPKTEQPVKSGIKVLESSGKKVRYSKKSGEIIESGA